MSTLEDLPCHVVAEAVAKGFNRAVFFGPPGTGKTYLAVKSATDQGKPYVKITCTGGDMAAEYRGMFIPKGNEFKWLSGALTKAWTENDGEGCLLVLDEIDHAPEEVHSILHAGLDDPSIAGITLPTGKHIKPGPEFRCIATMNGEPGDLPDALRDRFEAKVLIDRPSPDAMALLPEDIREAAEKMIMSPNPDERISFRQFLAYANKRYYLGEEITAQAVFGQRWSDVITALKLGA